MFTSCEESPRSFVLLLGIPRNHAICSTELSRSLFIRCCTHTLLSQTDGTVEHRLVHFRIFLFSFPLWRAYQWPLPAMPQNWPGGDLEWAMISASDRTSSAHTHQHDKLSGCAQQHRNSSSGSGSSTRRLKKQHKKQQQRATARRLT